MSRLPLPSLPVALHERAFLLLWCSRALATCGSALTFTVLPLAVYDLTGSAAALAMSLAGQTLMVIAFSMVGGYAADRWSRRGLIVGADLLRALLLCGLLLVDGADDLWIAYVGAAAATAAATLMRPAYSAIVPDLVSPRHLQQANLLNGLVGTLSGAVTPVLGVLIYAAVGLDGVVVATAASLVVAALLVACMRMPARPEPAVGTRMAPSTALRPQLGMARAIVRDVVSGAAVTWRDGMLRRLSVGAGLSGLGHGAMLVALVPFLREGMDLGAHAYGAALTTMSVSGVVANVMLVSRFAGVDPVRLYVVGMPWAGPLLLGIALAAGQPWLAFVLLGLYGAAAVLPHASATTLLQRHAPGELLGRVFAIGDLVNHACLLVGALAAGLAAEAFGPVAALVVAGFAYVAWGAVGMVMFRGSAAPSPVLVADPAAA